ncbi:MAG: chitobiase/beta-hexosaminidase C-terminal domain-containing protein, partial [Acetatifactor sp.]|nr:chitobiase/beta-hexosaminidase C-terminal domain-containing protein [Acetatifactor sp.]
MKRYITKLLAVSIAALVVFSSCDNGSSDSSNKETTPQTAPENPEKQDSQEENGEGIPVFSPIGGFYKEKQSVTIDATDMNGKKPAAIYYTLLRQTYDSNGKWDEKAWKEAVAASKPTESSTKYESAIELAEDTIIRAVAVYSDGTKRYALTCFDFDLDRSTDTDSQKPENPESTNWQDQTIYFILTDRFWNGDTTNDHIEDLVDQNGNAYDERVTLGGQPASG